MESCLGQESSKTLTELQTARLDRLADRINALPDDRKKLLMSDLRGETMRKASTLRNIAMKIPPELHTEFKIKCAREHIEMQKAACELIRLYVADKIELHGTENEHKTDAHAIQET